MAVLLYDRHLTTVRLIFANRLSEESFAQLEVLFGTDNAAGFIVIRKSMVTPVSCGFTKRSRAPPRVHRHRFSRASINCVTSNDLSLLTTRRLTLLS